MPQHRVAEWRVRWPRGGAVGEPKCKRQTASSPRGDQCLKALHHRIRACAALRRMITAALVASRMHGLPHRPAAAAALVAGCMHAQVHRSPGVGGAAGLPHACVRRRIARAAVLVAGAGLRWLPCFCLSLLQQMAVLRSVWRLKCASLANALPLKTGPWLPSFTDCSFLTYLPSPR